MSDSYNLQKVLNYIEKNITENLTIYDISRQAGFSVPHFYRLFKRLTGDSIGEYILRRKMAVAAEELRNSNEAIGSIAFKYGFESHDVFTRSFTRIYGVSPNKYRHMGGDIKTFPLKRQAIINNSGDGSGNCMNFSIVHSEGFYVIGMECDAKTWDEDGAVGRLWSDFLSKVNEIKSSVKPMVMYGICENETCKGNNFKYMAGVKVYSIDKVPNGMVVRNMKKGIFFQALVPEAVSTPEAYTSAVNYAKSLGYSVENNDDIEVYEDTFKDPDIHSFKLWIPVK